MTGTQLVRASAAASLRGLRRALVSPGIVILGRPALRNLGKLIGGTCQGPLSSGTSRDGPAIAPYHGK